MPHSAVAQACAEYPQAYPAGTDLDDANQRLRTAQTKADPAAQDIACSAWRLVLRDHPTNTILQLDWQANVAANLVWLGQSSQAQPLFEQVYAAYQASGPAQDAKAGTVAAMLAFIHNQRGESAAALSWSQRAVDALSNATEGVTASDRLRTRINHGGMLSAMRRFDEAQAAFDAVLAEAMAQPDALAEEAATVLNGLAVLARRQSRYGEALAIVEREIDWREAKVPQDPVFLVNAMQNRGLLLLQLARYDEAESALRAAIRRAEAAQVAGGIDLMGHQSALRETMSALLLARGKPDEARLQAAEAVRQLAGRPEAASPRGARPLRRLAEAQFAQGSLAEGMASYRQALALLPSNANTTDSDTLQALRLGYARALIELGDPGAAEAVLNQAAADPRVLLPEELARQHSLRAALAQQRADVPAALAATLAADAALAASLPPNHPQRQLIGAQACELAAAHCPQAIDIQVGDNPELSALLQLSLARRARADARVADADALARAALVAASAAAQPRLVWQAYALLADLRADAGRRAEAILFGKLALALLQQQRERLLPMGSVADARYLADKAPLYRRVAQWLLEAGRIPEALEVMQGLKQHEQAQFNERGSARADPANGLGGLSFSAAEHTAMQQFEAALRADASNAAELQALSEREAAQRITADERLRLRQLQQDLARQRSTRLARLDAALDGLRLSPGGTSARAWAVSRLAPPPAGQLNVYLLAGEQRLSLLLSGPRGSRIHQLPLPAATLALQIGRLRDGLQQHADVQPQARELHEVLGRWIDVAARQQGVRRVRLWLDGPLRYLPLGLLHDGRQYLAQRYEWVVSGGEPVPRITGRALPAMPAADKGMAVAHGLVARVAAFGVTLPLQGLPALPAVADELCDIVNGPVLGLGDAVHHCTADGRGRGPLRGLARLNGHFTEASLSAAGGAAADGQMLHIGTHFVLRPGQVSRSWLLLGDDTRLPLARLRSLPLGSPRLVTLSACETAVAGNLQAGDGREVDGLAGALLDNGAHQVLASLWRVNDRATAGLMRDFYAALVRAKGDATAALATAQRQAIAAGAPAYHWAAFVLVSNSPALPR